MKNPLMISIIIPVYNVAPFLMQCIDSVIEQSFKNIEIILINDGSTDHSGEICDAQARLDQRIRVIHQRNVGLSQTRNRGILESRGDYVMFLDSDDWIENDTCERALTAAIDHQADVVFWSMVKEYEHHAIEAPLFKEDQVFEKKKLKGLHRRIVGLMNDELRQPTKSDAISSAWGKLFLKSILIDHQLYFRDTQEIGSEDSLFSIQLFTFVKKAVYLHAFFNHYRQYNPYALTRNYKPDYFPALLTLFGHAQDFLDQQKLSGDYQVALNNRIALSVINNFLNVTSDGNQDRKLLKINRIKEILQHDLYRHALGQLRLKNLPLHWKVYFGFCKQESANSVYVLTRIMRKMR